MSSEHTHYDNLRVTRNASAAIIKAAYRALCMEYHPDKTPGKDTTRIMQIINEAYDVLSDSSKRAAYDAKLKAQEAASGGDAQRRQQEQAAREEAARAKREQEAREAAAQAKREQETREREAAEAAAKAKAQEEAKRNTTKQPSDLAAGIGVAVVALTIVGMIVANSGQQSTKPTEERGATMTVPAPASDVASATTVAMSASAPEVVQAVEPAWHWIASEPEADGRLGTYFSNLKCAELGKKSFGYMVQYGDHGVEQRGCWNVSKGPDGVVMRVVYPRAAENESQGANRTWAPTDVVWLSEARAGLAGYKIPDRVRAVYDTVERDAKAASDAAAKLVPVAEAPKPEPVAMSTNSWKYLSSDLSHHFNISYATNKLSIDAAGVHALVLVSYDSMFKNTAGVERKYETGLVDVNCASNTYVSGNWENFDAAWVKVGDTGREGSQRSFVGVGAVGDALREICRVAGEA